MPLQQQCYLCDSWINVCEGRYAEHAKNCFMVGNHGTNQAFLVTSQEISQRFSKIHIKSNRYNFQCSRAKFTL